MLKNEPEKIKTLIEMYNSNHTHKEIALVISVRESTIWSYISKTLIPNKIVEKKDKQSIYNKKKKDIIELYNKGFTYLEISKTLNINESALRDYIYRRLILKNLVTPRFIKNNRK
jgi:DNA-directed RNA polymerase specialized sigma24 family protein